MSTPLTALCQLLVEDIFGDNAAQLFRTLSYHGRLASQVLSQHSGLNLRQVRHGLAILIQHNLVLWTADDRGFTSYEVHLGNAYNIIRQGKLLRVVTERYGQLGQSITTTLLLTGHGRVDDIIKALVADKKKLERKPVSQTNGDHKPDGSVARFDEEEWANTVRLRILALIDSGFISIVHDSHFRPIADVEKDARKLQLEAHGDKVKKVDEASFEKKIKDRMINWKYNCEKRQEVLARTGLVEVNVAKRRRLAEEGLDDLEGPAKKLRLDDDVNDRLKFSWKGVRNRDLTSLDGLVVKFNYEKLAVIIRNERLVALGKQQVNSTASLLYEEVLERLTKETLFCKGLTDYGLQAMTKDDDDEEDEDEDNIKKVSTKDVVDGVELPDNGDGIGLVPKAAPPPTNGVQRENGQTEVISSDEEVDPQSASNKRKKRKASAMKRKHESDEDEEMVDAGGTNGFHDDDESPYLVIRSHLLLLTEGDPKLATIHRGTHRAPESWSVDFQGSAKELRDLLMFEIIKARFSQSALRLVNILREKGKFEQKPLQQSALLNTKTVHQLLSSLHTAGYVELQEIPKDNTRAPNKTIYLWFFDANRCITRMLEDAYKAMTRTLQRITIEKKRHENIIQKSERTDVVGNEDEMLSDREKKELAEWRANHERLMAELGRLDDVVLCLRDF